MDDEKGSELAQKCAISLRMLKSVETTLRNYISQTEEQIPLSDPVRQRWMQRQIKDMQESLVTVEEAKQVFMELSADIRRGKLVRISA